MNINSGTIDLKVFLIDKNFYEFKGKKPNEIIDVIKENHLKKLRTKYEFKELKTLNISITHTIDGEFELWSYCYNQPKDQNYWRLFLPDSLTETQNFEISEFSFVLFIKYKSKIYCVIGGSGMTVIKKYIDPSFGINIYQHFAKPTEDLLIELNARGIASNISQKRHTFNLNQTISEALEYSEIPTKIKIVLRKELVNGIFKKYELGDERCLLEVGSYFYLRKKIDFEHLKLLVTDLYKIGNNDNFTQLTLFRNIEDEKLINELDKSLQSKIIDDVISYNSASSKNIQQDVLEVVHPSKLERFYECNKFIIRAKNSRGKKDIEITDRSKLYTSCIKHINNNSEDLTNRFEIGGKLFTLNISGEVNGKQLTYGNFYAHITAEIDYLNKKYFRIDSHWYFLKDEFLQQMNLDAIDYYNKYQLKDNLLKKWTDGNDEDTYNKLHNDRGYYVLDKVINDNIELCDLLIIKNETAFFVHVKEGFNTKMRDLYVQVVLSAKRLSNDLKNNRGSSYLKKTLKLYNKRNRKNKIDIEEISKKIFDKELRIVFVMAYKNNAYKGKKSTEKIDLSKSNIAKYSIVQTVKEMQRLNFEINIFDISEI